MVKSLHNEIAETSNGLMWHRSTCARHDAPAVRCARVAGLLKASECLDAEWLWSNMDGDGWIWFAGETRPKGTSV
jgi:hypothetical protein